jgi:prolyl 4-hydroxylase
MKWPSFADNPFKLVRVPENLYSEILNFYNTCDFSQKEDSTNSHYDPKYGEHITAGSIAFRNPLGDPKRIKNPYTHINHIPTEKLKEWADILQPILEEWSHQKLKYSTGYGIRSYPKDSILCLHRDEIKTHIISCIIFIDEQPKNTNWPLDFWDHDGVRHKVVFEPGDMLLYESLCVHSRYTPFQGDYYRNMYFHWRPENWDYIPYKNNKVQYLCPAEVDDEYQKGTW